MADQTAADTDAKPPPAQREYMYGCPCCWDAYVPQGDRFACEAVESEGEAPGAA